MKRGAARRGRRVLQRMQQFVDVVVVGRIGTSVACRVNTRGTIEGIDGQSGIIGYRRQLRRSRSMLRFDQRVFGKRGSGLIGIDDTEFGLRDHLDAQTVQQSGYFPELAGVTAGHDDFSGQFTHYDAVAIASLCAVMISAMPLRARPSIAVNSSSVNA